MDAATSRQSDTAPERAPNGARAGATPVVFVPGVSLAGRGWDLLKRHLERNGFSDVGRLGEMASRGDIPHRADRLARQIDALRKITGSSTVHVVGHGVGGVVARYFVQVLGGTNAVSTLVTAGAPHAGSDVSPAGLGAAAAQLRPGSTVLAHLEASVRPMPVRWINYFSDDDLFIRPPSSGMVKHPALRAVNVLVTGHHPLSLVLPTFVCRSIAAELASAEGLPGFASPLSALPGGIVRLDDSPALVGVEHAGIRRAKAAHPSSGGLTSSASVALGPVPVPTGPAVSDN